MSNKKSKPSKTPVKNPTKQEDGSVDKEESLSNLSAIIATEKDTKLRKLHELVLERIKGLKKRP